MRTLVHQLPASWPCCEVLCLADLHVGDQRFDAAAFQRLLAWCREAENRRVILNGDLIDNAIRESVGDPYESALAPQAQKHFIEDALKPIADKILCAGVGNHEERSYRHGGHDPAEDIARFLGVPYFREGAFLFVSLGHSSRNKGPITHTIYVTHGWAGGRTPGAALNNAERLEQITDADHYVLGHTHKPMAYYKSWFRPEPVHHGMERVRHTFVNGGSLLGWGGYSERKGLAPTEQMMPVLVLDGRERRSEVRWL